MENNNTANNKYFETIIIGAGPAGLIAGWYLENALILDKKQEIGSPVMCGEGIARKAMERQGIKPDPSWISVTIDSIQTIMPDGKSFGEFQNEPGYVLDRTKFEKFLASKCKCKIQLNTKIVNVELKNDIYEITTANNEIFKSKYIIGADGPNSITRKKFFQEKINFIPAIEYVVKLEKEIQTNIIKIFFDNEKYLDGYAWLFPKSKNMANIGLGGKGNLVKTFNEFLENTIKPNYGNYELLKNKSGIIPFDDIKISDNEKIMLVGDAAGLVEPILGGGINQAMWSGRIAAESILKNEIDAYQSKVKAIPSADAKFFKASKMLYSLSNESLNELGGIIGKKGNPFLMALRGIIKILRNPGARKDTLKLIRLFLIYHKNKKTFF
jgi:digeranylgeranylglycerophospholipid reductase